MNTRLLLSLAAVLFAGESMPGIYSSDEPQWTIEEKSEIDVFDFSEIKVWFDSILTKLIDAQNRIKAAKSSEGEHGMVSLERILNATDLDGYLIPKDSFDEVAWLRIPLEINNIARLPANYHCLGEESSIDFATYLSLLFFEFTKVTILPAKSFENFVQFAKSRFEETVVENPQIYPEPSHDLFSIIARKAYTVRNHMVPISKFTDREPGNMVHFTNCNEYKKFKDILKQHYYSCQKEAQTSTL